MKDMDETDELLLNVSSGTPAMKSGLLVLMTLGEFPCKSIQVSTPERKMGEHSQRNYDVEILWELNEDNLPAHENRCKEIHCPTLSVIKKEEIIKKHVQAYNYSAAVEVAKTLSDEVTKDYLELLEMAKERALLKFSTAEKIAEKYKIDCFPVKSGNQKKVFEYAINLDIKLKRGEYVDFIRGITPIIVDLMERILKTKAGIKIDDYCKNTNRGREWDKKKLAGTKVIAILQKMFVNFQYGNISSEHLLGIIDDMVADASIKILAQELRHVEKKIRNMAAHEMVSVTDKEIAAMTGFTAKVIMDKIKQSFAYGGINIKKEYWDSYDEMNQVIIGRMK